MAKFDKKELAEACDGLKNAFVNKLRNENLPKKHEDWARLFETQAEKAIEENNKLLPYAFAEALKKETEALEKMLTNSKQNPEIMKENIEKVPPITSYGECTHQNRNCKYRKDGKCTGKGFLVDLCKNISEKELNESQEISKKVYEAIRDMGKTKKNNKTMNMKQITVINGNIVREDSNFFKAVQCSPRNPKARCENCAFDDCSNLEFSEPVFCNASERLDSANIVWRPMTIEEILNEIQKRKNSVADYQQLLESAKKAGEEAKYADDIVRHSKLIKDIERNINIYKSELEKMEKHILTNKSKTSKKPPFTYKTKSNS